MPNKFLDLLTLEDVLQNHSMPLKELFFFNFITYIEFYNDLN